jgi:hypothetical protein
VIPASVTAQDFMSFGEALSKIRQISYQQCLKERHPHSTPSQNPHISTQRPRVPDNKGMPDPGTNELSCVEMR